MHILGDCKIGTIPSLTLRFIADPSKPRAVDASGHAHFTIGQVELYSGDQLIDDPLEKEATACESALETYYGYALQHQVDSTPMYQIIVDLHEQLGALRVEIERKKEPWWKRILAPIVKAVAVVLDFLGWPTLSALARRALQSREPKQLPPVELP